MRNLFCAPLTYLLLAGFALAACSDDEIDSDEAARRAYLGLDGSISKAIELGFKGFNEATNANIAPQTANAMVGGTLTVTGQVDSGQSSNKQMRLNIGMVNYDDGDVKINEDGDTIHIVYNTDTVLTNQPYLQMSLANFPAGTLTGMLTSNSTMTGVYHLTGDITADLTLNLTIAGTTMAGTTTMVERVPGTTTITGTATNGDGGVYNISITI